MKALTTFLALTLSVLAWCVQGIAGPYRVDLTTNPAVVPVGKAKLIIKVTDQSGKPVTGAIVKAIAKMPGMVMGEREETAVPGMELGTYTAPAQFAMGGAYEATISISGPQGTGQAVLQLQTGQSTAAAGGGVPWGSILLWGGIVAAILIVVVQMRRTGQSVNLRGVFSRQVLVSLLVLGVALAIAVWAVNSQRREGSMTPIEAQVMEMNAPAPEGVLPVRLAKAEKRAFSSTVSYSGQAVGYVEQDVVPRVTGAIVEMNVYVGDRVSKGQVLARLDTSQIDPMVSEKAAGVSTAEHGVNVSAMEYQQALNGITQARAEVSMARGELAEARAMLEAAQQGRGSAEADVASAQAEVEAMQAELKAAQADSEYQQQDLARNRQLYDAGAISKDEWQRAQAEAQKSAAMVNRAQENVRRAQAGVTSARAGLRKVDAEISAARRKVQQAEASVRAKQAGVTSAQSAAAAAKGRIGQAQAGVREAAAATKGVLTQKGFATLRAEVDGVVTQRLISPGTVVAPGQAVLKVAQISPIRLQANVPEADLARVRVGAIAKITRRGTSEPPIIAKVTSVSPSLDPTSRTGVVEALFVNQDGRFLPGQFLSMDITVSDDRNAVVIPLAALQNEGQGAERRSYVWVADPGMNGEYTVQRRDVRVADSSKESVAIREGLRGGETVIVSPPQGLVAGTRIADAGRAVAKASTDQPQIVEITNAGYNPPSIAVPAGKAFKLTFVRRTDETCGTEIVFPDLGIREPLPLNKPVTITVPAQPPGRELNFTCPMDMLKGKAVAQ
jgi:RND family efflux transporter MFP subunit